MSMGSPLVGSPEAFHMAVNIKTTILRGVSPVGDPLQTGSRPKASETFVVRPGDVIEAEEASATVVNWTLEDAPITLDGTRSSAVPSPVSGASTSFILDFEGAYLLKATNPLNVNDNQTVRIRVDSLTAGLSFVAWGEQNTGSLLVPFDIGAHGWSETISLGFEKTLAILRRSKVTGRVVRVDANRGFDYTQSPDDPAFTNTYPGIPVYEAGVWTTLPHSELTAPSSGAGDFGSVQQAINWIAASSYVPSEEYPWVVEVADGIYEEDVAFQPFIHVVSARSPMQNPLNPGLLSFGKCVTLRGNHLFVGTSATDAVFLSGLFLDNYGIDNAFPVLKASGGQGVLCIHDTVIDQSFVSGVRGDTVSVEGPYTLLFVEAGVYNRTTNVTSGPLRVEGGASPASVVSRRSSFIGFGGSIDLNLVSKVGGGIFYFSDSSIRAGLGGALPAVQIIGELQLVISETVNSGGPVLVFNPDDSGGGLSQTCLLRGSEIDGDIRINDGNTGGVCQALVSSSSFGALTGTSVTHGILTVIGGTNGLSVAFDPATSGMAANTVQAALLELHTSKMALVPTATENNLATFNAAGQVKDGGALPTNAATVTVVDTASTTCWLTLFEAATGNCAAKTDAALKYNAATGELEATSFKGPLTGNASSATTASACSGNAVTATAAGTISGVADTASATCWLALFEAATGTCAAKTDGSLLYNASTALLSIAKLYLSSMVSAMEVDAGVSGANKTIDWNSGNNQKVTFDNSCIFAFTAPSTGVAHLTLRMIQPVAGGKTVTWPATVKWSGGTQPTWDTTASRENYAFFYWNGSFYVGSGVTNITP